MQERNKLGHNKPPKTIEEQINDQGRIKLSNSIIRQLKRKVDDKGNYVETVYSDTEKVGLKAKVNLSKKNIKVKKKLKLSNVDFILFMSLEYSLIKYYSACGYKIKNKIY